jgi:hypothetical protein
MEGFVGVRLSLYKQPKGLSSPQESLGFFCFSSVLLILRLVHR